MSDFKIEYEPDWGNKYRIYRKEYKLLGFSYNWKSLQGYESLEAAEADLQQLKKFPKYYSCGKA